MNKEIKVAKEKIEFLFDTGVFSGITANQIRLWKEACPAVNVEGEIRFAALWAASNPAKRKKNWLRFLTNWIVRKQERGGSILSTAQSFKVDQDALRQKGIIQ